ncbi:MAG: GNAT family N-acetyltransferase [Kofleriaceae bacterium]|nr:GNAT family N-acetyltransferase [Kofleriaceae bacterium]
MHIRKATQSDLPALLKFEQGIITAERHMDPTLKEGPINYYDLGEYLDATDTEVVVAETGGKLVGSGYGQIRKNRGCFKYPEYGSIGFMFVDEDYRGQAIAKQIIEHLNSWFASRNIEEVRLTVYDKNPGAIKAYEKAGFEKHLIEMRLNLKDK